jgi:hypothetical protein
MSPTPFAFRYRKLLTDTDTAFDLINLSEWGGSFIICRADIRCCTSDLSCAWRCVAPLVSGFSYIFLQERGIKGSGWTCLPFNKMSECSVCLESGEQVKCTQCEGWICLECNQRLDVCPFCRKAWAGAAERKEEVNPEAAQVVIDMEMVMIDAVVPPLDPPDYVRGEFKENPSFVGYDDSQWWFDDMELNRIVQVPWRVFEEFTDTRTDALFRNTHSVWAIKTSYGFVDAGDHVELTNIRLFHFAECERIWEIERIVYE